MEHIDNFMKREPVRLDPDRLTLLYQQMGERGADDVICRAIEELAVRLSHCERLWREERWGELRKCARSLIAISDQVGMSSLARVAHDVTKSIDNSDAVAVSATLHRLTRIGERSLLAVWDLQDLSV